MGTFVPDVGCQSWPGQGRLLGPHFLLTSLVPAASPLVSSTSFAHMRTCLPEDALEWNTIEETSEAAPEAVRQAVGGGYQSGWGRLLSVTNAIEAGTCRQGDSGRA